MSNRFQEWTPNSLEKKCLKDLDSPENWQNILKTPRPSSHERQSWRPFWRIYVINIALFLAVFAFLFGSLEIGFSGFDGLREDFAIFVVFVGVMATGFAAYVTYLYRRSWNRRAKQLSLDADY